jgi:hypothetical protein
MSADARAKPKADEDQAGGFQLLGAGAHFWLPRVTFAVLGDQVNAVLLVPAGRLNDDFGKRPLARQHRGQKYAVVARVRLAADHGNVEAVGSPRNELSTVRIPAIPLPTTTNRGRCKRLMLMLTRALCQGPSTCACSTTS